MRLILYAAGAVAWTGLTLATGCQRQDAGPEDERAELRAADDAAGEDRSALSRLVGVWDFEGWSARDGEGRQHVSGTAAATAEDGHFVLMDLQASRGQLGGRAGRKAGSMLFASEPGIGLTVTAWGDASPSVSRLVGERDGSVFAYTEMPTPAGRRRHALTIRFETDDRWVAEIRNESAAGEPVVASYRFTRSPGNGSSG